MSENVGSIGTSRFDTLGYVPLSEFSCCPEVTM